MDDMARIELLVELTNIALVDVNVKPTAHVSIRNGAWKVTFRRTTDVRTRSSHFKAFALAAMRVNGPDHRMRCGACDSPKPCTTVSNLLMKRECDYGAIAVL